MGVITQVQQKAINRHICSFYRISDLHHTFESIWEKKETFNSQLKQKLVMFRHEVKDFVN
jgi:hypothetical protein